MRRFIASAVVLGVFLAAPPALADETISAAVSNRYVNTSVTIDQGEKLSFTNSDIARHDVTAADSLNGKPLFSTPLVGQNQSALVDGSQYLTTGSYGFFCSVHPFMTGTLSVSSAGTPVPRPGTGGGSGGGAPEVRARVTSGSKRGVRRARSISVRVTSNEAARLRIRITGGGRAIASGSFSATTDAATHRVRLSAAGRRLVARRGALRISVAVTATDESGNAVVARASKTLR